MKKRKDVQDKADQHQWLGVLAIEKAFLIANEAGLNNGAVDWSMLARAAYHAGAATALRDILFDWTEKPT